MSSLCISQKMFKFISSKQINILSVGHHVMTHDRVKEDTIYSLFIDQGQNLVSKTVSVP